LTGNNYLYFKRMCCFPVHGLLGPEDECTTFLRNVSKYQSITFGTTFKKVRILIEDWYSIWGAIYEGWYGNC